MCCRKWRVRRKHDTTQRLNEIISVRSQYSFGWHFCVRPINFIFSNFCSVSDSEAEMEIKSNSTIVSLISMFYTRVGRAARTPLSDKQCKRNENRPKKQYVSNELNARAQWNWVCARAHALMLIQWKWKRGTTTVSFYSMVFARIFRVQMRESNTTK